VVKPNFEDAPPASTRSCARLVSYLREFCSAPHRKVSPSSSEEPSAACRKGSPTSSSPSCDETDNSPVKSPSLEDGLVAPRKAIASCCWIDRIRSDHSNQHSNFKIADLCFDFDRMAPSPQTRKLLLDAGLFAVSQVLFYYAFKVRRFLYVSCVPVADAPFSLFSTYSPPILRVSPSRLATPASLANRVRYSFTLPVTSTGCDVPNGPKPIKAKRSRDQQS
jgi:hypothetical protein